MRETLEVVGVIQTFFYLAIESWEVMQSVRDSNEDAELLFDLDISAFGRKGVELLEEISNRVFVVRWMRVWYLRCSVKWETHENWLI